MLSKGEINLFSHAYYDYHVLHQSHFQLVNNRDEPWNVSRLKFKRRTRTEKICMNLKSDRNFPRKVYPRLSAFKGN